MNYRHIYHAGHICDVVKHAALALIVRYLQTKERGFAVLDTHAGCGLYDLTDPCALKTGEANEGVQKLWVVREKAKENKTLTPYLDVLHALNTGDTLRFYPGSPVLTRRLLRPQDRLIACELHPDDVRPLRRTFFEDAQVNIHHRDGYEALRALTPFPEKRGLILIDPPFETPDEIEKVLAAARHIKARFPKIVLALWYPIKERPAIWAFHEGLRAIGFDNVLVAEFIYRPEVRHDRLNGTGLVIINPPFRLEAQLQELFPALHEILETENRESVIRKLTS
jgi:23S rRNA (adenine2030-N6)-methyltransferase